MFEFSDEDRQFYETQLIKHRGRYIPKPKKVKRAKIVRRIIPPEDKKWISYQDRAAKKELEFTLTRDEFDSLISGICVYCGQPSSTIDRRESTKGYTITNSQSCCYMCNIMKFTFTHEQFLSQINRIYSFKKEP